MAVNTVQIVELVNGLGVAMKTIGRVEGGLMPSEWLRLDLLSMSQVNVDPDMVHPAWPSLVKRGYVSRVDDDGWLCFEISTRGKWALYDRARSRRENDAARSGLWESGRSRH